MAQGTHVRIGGVWKEVTNVWVRIGGVWKSEVRVHERIGGTWRESSPTYQQEDFWTATWGQTYVGKTTKRTDTAGNQRLYHGYSSGWGGGNYQGAFGFDYADIQSTLSGRTIDSVELRLANDHFYYSSGTIRGGSHNHTSEPATFTEVDDYTDPHGWDETGWNVDETKTITLDTSVGTAFRDGTIKGLFTGQVAGTPSLTELGYCHAVDGQATADKPRLYITHSP